MNQAVSQKQIGQRIMALRKLKGLSQESLAKSIHISRPSLAQIELGNRSVSLAELQKLSMVLGFTLDYFMSANFSMVQDVEAVYETRIKEPTERVRISQLQPEKLRNIILYLLERCAGKPNVGETVLYKLLYFADFNYYEMYEEYFIGAEYRKLPYGPVPEHLDSIINRMIREGELQRIKSSYDNYPVTRYLPLQKADLTKLLASEKQVLDDVILLMSDWSAAAIANYSHKDIPWLASKDGETISYELVFYREVPYSVRNYSNEIEH